MQSTSTKNKPSVYQEAIYDAFLHTDKNIVVSAGPGSGKTTTAIEISKLIPPGKESLFAAFNKSIVEELSKRLPETVACKTLHSIGVTALISHFKTSFRINEFKCFPFIEEVLKKKPEELKREPKGLMAYKFAIKDAINLVRMTMTELNVEALFQMCMYYDVDLLQTEMIDIIDIMKKLDVYNRSFNKKHNYIDYTDMIFLPATNWKIKVPQYDYITLDECQDVNRAQQIFLERLLKPKGRTIVIGDEKQSLYSFMGADIESFKRFENKNNTITLSLPICYRCGTEIVKLAQKVYPNIEPCLANHPGEIRFGNIDEIQSGDMVLCRNNRPLVSLYFKLLRQEKNPILIGADIQVGLEALISKVLKKRVEDGLEDLYERLNTVGEELISKGVKNIKEHPKYESLKDKILTIEIIGERFETMKEVRVSIVEMFKEKEDCIKLMTIHKSKGLEADRVFYIERFDSKRLLPSLFATKDWQVVQETNLKFVMLTRSKRSIIFIQNLNH